MYQWESRKKYESFLPCGCAVHKPHGTKRIVIKDYRCKIKHKNVHASKWIREVRIDVEVGKKPRMTAKFEFGNSPLTDFLQRNQIAGERI